MRIVYFDNEKIIHEIALNDNEKAFRSFFDHHYDRLLHLSLIILRNREVAEDVVLEVFEKIWEQRADLINIDNITTYLFVLVKNKSIDQLRKKKELIALEEMDSNLSEVIFLHHPENIFLDNELIERVNRAILNLPEKCRLVYRLIKEDGLKYKEVSELLNLSPKTIDNHLSNAMSKIRHEVSAYLGTEKTEKVIWKVLKSLLLFLPF